MVTKAQILFFALILILGIFPQNIKVGELSRHWKCRKLRPPKDSL